MLRDVRIRLRALLRRGRVEAELDEELRFHLEQQTLKKMQSGMNREEAARQARMELGGVEQTKEEARNVRGVNFVETTIRDVRYGLRQLRRSPGFTVVAILTLALGIGANTAIFSLLNAVMLRELPVEKPAQLVLLGTGRLTGSTGVFADTDLFSYPFFREMQQRNQVFSNTSAVLSLMFRKLYGAVGGSGSIEPIGVQLVSGTYFRMLGVKPILGRAFSLADDEPAGGHPVAVASYSWWMRRFARDPSVVGRTVAIRSTVYTIIGVAPAGFFGTTVGQSPDLWIPLSMEKEISPGWNGLHDSGFQSLYILGRLKTGVTLGRAQVNVNLLARQIWRGFTGGTPTERQQRDLEHAHIELTPAARGLSGLRQESSSPLLVLMIAVGLVLLVACANISSLLLSRSTARQREIAVRMAIGAGRGRLIRQMLTESVLMTFFGGALGVLFAWWACQALLGMVSEGSGPLPLKVAPDATVLTFTLTVVCLTALLFGTFPALRATRIDLGPALKEARGGVAAAGRNRTGKALIVFQVAISLVLLVGAGLFLRTLVNLFNVDTGFNQANVLLFAIDPAAAGYKQDSRLVNLYSQVEQKIDAEPGVRAASISLFNFSDGKWTQPISIPGHPPTPQAGMSVSLNVVGPGYFEAMGIPLLGGRVFGRQDAENSPKVAVINETLAKLYFPGGSPIGRQFGIVSGQKRSSDIEVVGVVRDAKHESLREGSFPAAYFPYTQSLNYYNDLEVRYSGDPAAIIAEVRRAVGEVDHRLPISYQSTLLQRVDSSVVGQTIVAGLSGFFGMVAAFLACMGIYGLLSYDVTRRISEIGVRMALGANRQDVMRNFVGRGLLLTLIGVAIGLGATFVLTRFLSGMLYGLTPTDPLTFVAASLLLTVAALAACYIPALRAMRIDPAVVLRHE